MVMKILNNSYENYGETWNYMLVVRKQVTGKPSQLSKFTQSVSGKAAI